MSFCETFQDNFNSLTKKDFRLASKNNQQRLGDYLNMDMKTTKMPDYQIIIWSVARKRAYRLDGGGDNGISLQKGLCPVFYQMITQLRFW